MASAKDALRFWAKVKKTGTCWLWVGARASREYGLFIYGGRRGYAHRFSYEFHAGAIPEGLTIDHVYPRCTSKLCVRPSHLEPVTLQENSRRAPRVGLLVVRIKCPNCGRKFERPRGGGGKLFTSCSPHCRGVFSRRIHVEGLTKEIKTLIKTSILEEFRRAPVAHLD